MIRIEFSQTDLKRIFSALNRVLSIAERESIEVAKRSAIRFTYNVRENLMSQKYSSRYRALSDPYAKKKANEGLPPGFWRYQDELFSQITTFVYVSSTGTSYWAGGIIPGATNFKGDDITIYGLKMEHGSDVVNQSPRPLFGPTTEDFSKLEWIEENNRSLRNIKRGWR